VKKLLSLFGAVTVLACAQAGAAPFADVLDTSAFSSPLAAKELLESVSHAGRRLVAVGQRGHIVVSDDGGFQWKQSPVPVSSDLTSVFFADAHEGWAVGHDGVILHSSDAGDTWKVQLSRRGGPDKSFLDVWFSDARTGFAVGADNLIYHTADGGSTWQSWSDRTENPKSLNLHAIRLAGGTIYIAGEAGLVLRMDSATQRFVAVAVPYNGSFFGVADASGSVVLFGLRGNVFTSPDGRAWSHADAGLAAAVVAATHLPDGRLVLADAGGRISTSADAGRTFVRLEPKPAAPVAGIAAASDADLILVGPRGAVVAHVKK
jgi:photosystem II stability/assembly factor-like uncharacterized protein